VSSEEEEVKGASGEVGKTLAAPPPPGSGEKAGSMPRAVSVGEAHGKPGE
jgi:hypothetical protein